MNHRAAEKERAEREEREAEELNQKVVDTEGWIRANRRRLQQKRIDERLKRS